MLNAQPAPSSLDPTVITGIAAIAALVYASEDIDPLRQALIARLTTDPNDAAALLDASLLLQLTGQRDEGLNYQAAALALRRHYRRPYGRADGLKILALVAPGDLMANTPIDFLLEGSNFDLNYLFVDADTDSLDHAPEHDLVFVAVGESEANLHLLQTLEALLADWPVPVINGDTARIAGLTRDQASALLAGEPSILCPINVRASRGELEMMAAGELEPPHAYPLIVRPVGLHAGDGLRRLDSAADIAPYLAGRRGSAFYLAPWIDYAGPDGLFRKQRIVFIDGRAYPSHFAASADWIVHYLSAGMNESAAKRREEAAWMASFDEDFAARHAVAFAALQDRLGLDYFGIDSAESRDGRLLVFEVDTAMIVHALDPSELFPYKKPAMRRLFAAFQAMLEARARDGAPIRLVTP